MRSIYSDFEDDEIDLCVSYVFDKLKMTTDIERHFLSSLFIHSCTHDIEEDLHEDITLFERVSGLKETEIINILRGLTNLGFEYSITKTIDGCNEEENVREYKKLSVKLSARSPKIPLENLTIVLFVMYFGAAQGKCESCCIKTLNRLDFSDLKEEIREDHLEAILSFLPYDN